MLKLGQRTRGHFVTLIEISVHLITCIPYHRKLTRNFQIRVNLSRVNLFVLILPPLSR